MTRDPYLAARGRLMGAVMATAVTVLMLAFALALATPALAEEPPAPWWRVESRTAPAHIPPGGEGELILKASNVGDAETNGTPVTVTDTMPRGLIATEIGTEQTTQKPVTCVPATFPEGTETFTETIKCTTSEKVAPFEVIEVVIKVKAEKGATAAPANTVRVEGGGAPGVSATGPNEISGEPTTFGVEKYALEPENVGGALDTQAGSHPFQLTTTLDLNQVLEANPQRRHGNLPHVAAAPALLHDLQIKLPPGLVGDATPAALPECSDRDFATIQHDGQSNACASDTAVGAAIVNINEPAVFGVLSWTVPVFNLVPAPGEPARFGIEALKVPIILDTSVRSGEDYRAVVSVRNASQAAQVLGSQVTLWGNPGSAVHNQSRGWNCLVNGADRGADREPCTPPAPHKTAFLSLPTSCTGSLTSSVLADSWLEPGPRRPDGSAEEQDPRSRWKKAESSLPPLGGCESLPFEPSISVEPETHAGNTPSKFTVDVHLPQTSTLEEEGKAESAVKESTVTLPEGVLLNPSAANGLDACAEGETERDGGVGFLGFKEFGGTETATFTAPLPSPLVPGVNFCPDASKVGVVHIKSPDLANELEGGVYLAEQNANPFGSIFAMYIVAEDPVSKVMTKLAGEVSVSPSGRITTTFKNTPQVPFEDLKLELFGGTRASITTPPMCGAYATATSFVPWSGTAAQAPSSAFNISSGAEGTGCSNPGPRPLAPGFSAQSTNLQAGAFTPFEVNLTRPDAQQALTLLTMRLPKGAAAMLASVTLCPEPQAAQGTCGPESLIGHATAVAGLGATPFTVTGGQVFITGPYNGAPFGLTVVIPTKAGPFDFGNVVTRSALNVDRDTGQAIITSKLPTFVETAAYPLTGVPAQLKEIHVVVDRPNFQFNPTNCSPLKVEGAATGDQGTTAPITSPFQVANCGSLPFKPTFEASTGAQASKNNGASLRVRVTSGFGQANIGKTFLALPLALPSRLTTLQKACLAVVFEANPASCPEGSNIGTATAHTPVLKNPLTGPAYLVSHGSEAFPDVQFVLQGEGITLVLDGKTDIKKGITYSRFESLPDAPVSEFETLLPTGPHSALTANVPQSANYSLCGTNLVMPTTLTGQNGAVIKQETVIKVVGCGHSKASPTRAQLLAKALAQCKRKYKHKQKRRLACERQARKKYGAKKASAKHKKH